MADDWRSTQYRQSVVAKIDEAIRNSGNPTSKNAIEMENHFFQKAKTREDYLGFLARLLLHVNEMNKKNAQQGQIQMPGPGMQDSMGQNQGPQGIGMVQMGNQSQPSALINQLNQRPMNTSQGPMGQSGPQQQTHDWDMMGQQNQMLQQQCMPPQNFNPNQSMNQGMVNQNMMPQQMMGMGQGPQQMQQGPGMMNTRPRMQIAVKMAPNQTGPQGVVQQQLGGMMPQQQQFMSQQPNQMMQQQQQQNQLLQQQQMMQQQQRKMDMQGGPGGNIPTRTQYGLSPAGQGLQSVPSPAMSGGGIQQMAPSPHYANSPGGNQGVAPSPGSAPGMQRVQPGPQGQVRGTNMGAPSPGMGSVNTPQSHHLQAGGIGGPMDPQMVEEQMYIEKVRELGRKYIEPLRRMIEKIGNEDTEKLGKMRNLLNVLENPQKRVPMETLLKCESVLEKMDFKKTEMGASAPGSVQPPSVSFAVPIPVKESSQFQPLLEAVAANIKSPLINHTLKRTFGPVVATLSEPFGLDFDYFAPKRKRYTEEEDDEAEMEPSEIARDVLQKEIGTIDRKFVIDVSKEPYFGCKGLPVVCRLVDKHIPSVPDMEVVIPENYPFSSPVFQLPESENENNPFHKRVLQNMEARLSRLQYTFSLSQLLDMWESSVRQACNPKNPGGDQILLALNKLVGM